MIKKELILCLNESESFVVDLKRRNLIILSGKR
jgi:hypothetical protein